MTEHTYFECNGTAEAHCPGAEDIPGTCNFCDGGLAYCTVCGGGEAQLATECPGRPMTERESDLVMAGVIDYYRGAWRGPRIRLRDLVGQSILDDRCMEMFEAAMHRARQERTLRSMARSAWLGFDEASDVSPEAWARLDGTVDDGLGLCI